MKPNLLPIALLAVLTTFAGAQDPYKKTPPGSTPVPGQEAPTVLSLREETFVISRKEAPAFLRGFSSDAARYEELLRRVKSGQATLERLQLLRAKSGQRSVVEAIEEFRWPIVEPAKDGAQPVSTSETRAVGDTLEVEPVIGPDGRTIDLNLVAQSTRFMGYTKSPDKTVPVQPILRSRKITTAVTLLAGDPMLIGSLNPPVNSGLEDTEDHTQLHLDFITVFIGSDSAVAELVTSRTKSLSDTLIIPSIELRNASLAQTVEYLQTKGRELDPEKKGLNFIVKAPPSHAGLIISLTLKNIPIGEAARYAAELAGLKLTITENALVFHAPGEAP